jgi:membrane-associated phospholipid phosphatase
VIRSVNPTALDASGVRWARTLPHPRPLERALAVLSRATDHSDAWLVASLVGATLDRSRRGRWLEAGARVALAELSSQAIKRAVPRARPRLEGLPPLAPTPSPMSFPSSHTAAAVAAMSAFEGLLPSSALRSLALVTAFSRLYLGVHFPSDVIAGAGLGRLVATRSSY